MGINVRQREQMTGIERPIVFDDTDDSPQSETGPTNDVNCTKEETVDRT